MQSRVKSPVSTPSNSTTRACGRSTFATRALVCGMYVFVGACSHASSTLPAESTSGAGVATAAGEQPTPIPRVACVVRTPTATGQDVSPSLPSFDAYFQQTTSEFSALLEHTRTTLSGAEVSPEDADQLLREYVRTPDPLAVLTDRGWRLSATRLCGLGALVVSEENAGALMPIMQQAQAEGRGDDSCLSPCIRAVSELVSDGS
jgi:hypothetical protein